MFKKQTRERESAPTELTSRVTGYRVGNIVYYKPITAFTGYVYLEDKDQDANSYTLSRGAQIVAPEGYDAANVSIFQRGFASVFRVEHMFSDKPTISRTGKLPYAPNELLRMNATSPDSQIFASSTLGWHMVDLSLSTNDPLQREISSAVRTMGPERLIEFGRVALPLLYVTQYLGESSIAAA